VQSHCGANSQPLWCQFTATVVPIHSHCFANSQLLWCQFTATVVPIHSHCGANSQRCLHAIRCTYPLPGCTGSRRAGTQRRTAHPWRSTMSCLTSWLSSPAWSRWAPLPASVPNCCLSCPVLFTCCLYLLPFLSCALYPCAALWQRTLLDDARPCPKSSTPAWSRWAPPPAPDSCTLMEPRAMLLPPLAHEAYARHAPRHHPPIHLSALCASCSMIHAVFCPAPPPTGFACIHVLFLIAPQPALARHPTNQPTSFWSAAAAARGLPS